LSGNFRQFRDQGSEKPAGEGLWLPCIPQEAENLPPTLEVTPPAKAGKTDAKMAIFGRGMERREVLWA
jgi:hypothetical protein